MLLASLMLFFAAAEDPVPTPETKVAAAPAPAEPKICKRFVDTGSRIASRVVCMTRKQWYDRSLRSREDFEDTALHRR